MGADTGLTPVALHLCQETDWGGRTVVWDGFVSYDFQSGGIIGRELQTVQNCRWRRGSDDVTTSNTLAAVPVYFRAQVSQLTLETVRRDHNMYYRLTDKPDVAGVQEAGEGVALDALLEKNLFWRHGRDAGDVTDEVLDARLSLVAAEGYDTLVSEKSYLGLVRMLADKAQDTQRKSDVTTLQLVVQEAKTQKVELKVSYLTDSSIPVSDGKKTLPAQHARKVVLEESTGELNSSLALITWTRGPLRIELDSTRAAIG